MTLDDHKLTIFTLHACWVSCSLLFKRELNYPHCRQQERNLHMSNMI